MENSDHKALTALMDRGYRLIPLNGKKPLHEGYVDRSYSLDDLIGNVGLIVDEHHVDVDLDWDIPRGLLSFLPHTACAILRSDGCVRHMIYRSNIDEWIKFELPKSEKMKLEGPHAHTVLELRTSKAGEPYHVMISPSRHPVTDDQLYWDGGDVLPHTCDGDELVQCAGLVAAATFFVRFYPCEGGRDDFGLALAGTLVRAGWTDADAKTFFESVASEAGDDERLGRRADQMIAKASQRLDDDRPLRGLTSMAKLLGVPKEWINEVAVWLGIRKHRDGNAIFDKGLTVDTSRQAWAALAEYEVDDAPAVYAFGDMFARIDKDHIQTLEKPGLTHELNRCAKWLKPGTDDQPWIPTNASPAVVEDMMAARSSEITVPPLEEVANVPIFTRDGRLISERGYDDEAEVYLAPSIHVDVPEEPTKEQVQEAVELLLKPLADFPFEDESDRANALAMCIEPYIRDLFEIAPMYYLNKPVAGTGATLLVYACLYPALGAAPPTTTPPTREEEMEKFLTSALMDGGKVVFLDNATVLKGKSLIGALTADIYKARVLGYSRTVTIPVRVLWVTTGNNPDLENEMYRRLVDVRLDSKQANPEDRPANTFAIPDLKGWLKEHRAELVRAALTIIRSWVNAGMPKGSKSKASFEQWAGVLSGILEHAGVVGFLDTPKDRRPEDEAMEWMREVAVMWLRWMNCNAPTTREAGFVHEMKLNWSEPRKASEIAIMLEHCGIDLGDHFKDAARAVGDNLKQFKDRVFEIETKGGVKSYALRSQRKSNMTRWWLEEQ